MRTVIAITPWLRVLPTALGERTVLYTLDPAYAESINAAGAHPVILPHGRDAASSLAGIDGLVLSGGSDVHPASYRARANGVEDDASAEVDEWELALLAEARRQGLPTIGICRGMQLLAVAHGGTLVQHLPHDAHPGMGTLPPDQTLKRRHDVRLEPSSRLAQALGATRMRVNTIHHQAVANPGTLQVAGRGPDDVIEAVEAIDWPAFGVQWHPEKMHEPEQARLFEYLVAEAKAAYAAR